MMMNLISILIIKDLTKKKKLIIGVVNSGKKKKQIKRFAHQWSKYSLHTKSFKTWTSDFYPAEKK